MPFDIPGAPEHELTRSTAAAAVGRLARASRLRLFHFEHRVHLPLAEPWRADRPDLDGAPEWRGGALVEHKYAHFRYEQPIGSFHPGHRAKWTAHELCHALVGFAWRPDATPLFNTLAARLSELLPVALWYFLDEADLRRCPAHDGPLFDLLCPACEAAAGTPGEADPSWFARGRAFVDRELAAVQRSIRLGRPVGHRFATIDLRSDALAYVAAHGQRLASPEAERFVTAFHGPQTGHADTLDALAERVEALCAALCGGPDTDLALSTDETGWAAQDVAWRLLTVRAECDGDAAQAVDALVERLAADPTALGDVVTAYEAVHDAFYVPDPADLFAVGYDLPHGYGRSAAQVAQGLAQACPETAARVGDDLEPLVAAFLPDDVPERAPLARRFARWLNRNDTGAVADLAAYEAAVNHAAPPDAEADALGPDGEGWRLADGVEQLSLKHDPTAPDCPERPTYLAIRRTSAGDTVVAELAAPIADVAQLPAEQRDSLAALGVLVPDRYPLARSASPSKTPPAADGS